MRSESLLSTSLKYLTRFAGYHILSLVVALSIIALCPGVSGAYIAQGFCLGIIIMLPYMYAWQLGFEDINRIKSNVMKKDKFRGFKAGFIAYSPALFCGVLMVLTKLGIISEKFFAFYRLIESPFFALNQAIMPTVYTLDEQSMGAVILSVAVLLLPPLTVGVGYMFGLEEISFFDTYFPKKKKD